MEQEKKEFFQSMIEEKKAKRPRKKNKWRSKMTAILKTEITEKYYEELSTREMSGKNKNGKRRIIRKYRKKIKKSYLTMHCEVEEKRHPREEVFEEGSRKRRRNGHKKDK